MLRSLVATALALACSLAQAADQPVRDLTLPDPVLTPGVATLMGKDEICATKGGRDRRAVTAAMKVKVFAAYGLKGNKPTAWCRADRHGRVFEIDHLISRELGGADETLNLWPQCYSGKWSASVKDRYENFLHRAVCAGKLSIDDAQREIRGNWVKGYRSHPELPAPE